MIKKKFIYLSSCCPNQPRTDWPESDICPSCGEHTSAEKINLCLFCNDLVEDQKYFVCETCTDRIAQATKEGGE